MRGRTRPTTDFWNPIEKAIVFYGGGGKPLFKINDDGSVHRYVNGSPNPTPVLLAVESASIYTFEIIKSVDEVVNNSATLQSDDELIFSGLATGDLIEVEFGLFFDGPTAADFKFRIGRVSGGFNASSDAGYISYNDLGGVDTVGGINLDDDIIAFTTPGTSTNMALGKFIMKVGNPAQAGIHWSQNTVTVGDTTVRAGSFLRWRKLN